VIARRHLLWAGILAVPLATTTTECGGSGSTDDGGGPDSTTNDSSVPDTGGGDVSQPQDGGSSDGDAAPCIVSDAGGTLDQTFNTGSKSLGSFAANGATIDSSGRIYVVGIQASGCPDANAAAVYRFDVTGAIDSTYGAADGGGGGHACIHYDAVDAAYVAGVDSNGKLVVGGLSYDGQSDHFIHATVTRLNSDGTLDTSFHTTGQLDLDPKSNATHIGIGAVQGIAFLGSNFADKIVVTGSPEAVQVGVGTPNTGFVVRLTSDGQFDTAFATNGVFKDTGVDGFYGVRADASGTVTTVGSSLFSAADGGIPKAIVVRQLDVSGAPVTSFGTGGVYTMPLGGNFGDDGRDLAFFGSRIYAAASVDFLNGLSGQFGRVGVVALTSAGALDTTWAGEAGAPGTFLSNPDFAMNEYYQITSLATQCDGKLLTGATFLDLDGGDASSMQDIGVRRLTADGQLDPTFGNGGHARLAQVGNEVAVAVVQDPTTSKIVVVGRDQGGNTVLARFLP